MLYPIEKVAGKPVIGIGGGAYTKTFAFRAVIAGHNGLLKSAVFIRKSGDLSCRLDQGYTEIAPGDLILEGSGPLPIVPENPAVSITARKVVTIDQNNGIALTEDHPFRIADLPESVLTGAQLYHNRDGSYFAWGTS